MAFLSKEKLTKELNKTPMIAQHIDCMDLFDAINNSIAENVTEVVWCKDCKNLGYTNNHWFCKWLNRCVDEDWFCADGKKGDE